MSTAVMNRVWAMPSADTFDIEPIHNFVWKYLHQAKVSIDPFARNKRWTTYTNDLNPETEAEFHMEALEFLEMLVRREVRADLAILDPPYSPRQISECYKLIGKKPSAEDTQNARLYANVKAAIREMVSDGGIVLSFGWNSAGVGPGFELLELLLVNHGAAHNDTICLAERKIQGGLFDFGAKA